MNPKDIDVFKYIKTAQEEVCKFVEGNINNGWAYILVGVVIIIILYAILF